MKSVRQAQMQKKSTIGPCLHALSLSRVAETTLHVLPPVEVPRKRTHPVQGHIKTTQV